MKHPVTKIRKRRKKQVIEAFGGECQMCGYKKNKNALCFHHIDPTIKENTPTEIINQWSVERSIPQLIKEKVVLLCLNCHAEVHSEEYDCNLLFRENKIVKKECPTCLSNFFTCEYGNKKKQKFCSSECSDISRRKVENRPTEEELKLLLEKYSYVRVGKMYGVSDNAVRKWVKKYIAE